MDVDYQKLMDGRNKYNLFAIYVGIRMTEVRHCYAAAAMTVTENCLNSSGRVHGGVYFTLADTVCGTAATTDGVSWVTVDADYHFFQSASLGDQLTAKATIIKDGKQLRIFEATIFDQNGTLLGKGTFTFYRTGEALKLK